MTQNLPFQESWVVWASVVAPYFFMISEQYSVVTGSCCSRNNIDYVTQQGAWSHYWNFLPLAQYKSSWDLRDPNTTVLSWGKNHRFGVILFCGSIDETSARSLLSSFWCQTQTSRNQVSFPVGQSITLWKILRTYKQSYRVMLLQSRCIQVKIKGSEESFSFIDR